LTEDSNLNIEIEDDIALEYEKKKEERIRFVDRLEELDNVVIPRVKPKRTKLKRIKLSGLLNPMKFDEVEVSLNNQPMRIAREAEAVTKEADKISDALDSIKDKNDIDIPVVTMAKAEEVNVRPVESVKIDFSEIKRVNIDIENEVEGIKIEPYELTDISPAMSVEAPVVPINMEDSDNNIEMPDITLSHPDEIDISIPQENDIDLQKPVIAKAEVRQIEFGDAQDIALEKVHIEKPDFEKVDIAPMDDVSLENNTVVGCPEVDVKLPEDITVDIRQGDVISTPVVDINVPEQRVESVVVNLIQAPQNYKVDLNEKVEIGEIAKVDIPSVNVPDIMFKENEVKGQDGIVFEAPKVDIEIPEVSLEPTPDTQPFNNIDLSKSINDALQLIKSLEK
jgi:hypothetical protein